jgi:C4-dicarboxylate-specific signal transduction histidine kinase
MVNGQAEVISSRIMGPGMTQGTHYFTKVSKMKNYVSNKIKTLDREKWQQNFDQFKNGDYSESFHPADRRIPNPSNEEIENVLVSMGKGNPQEHLNCGACGYDTCIDHAIAMVEGLAKPEMCLPFTIEKLHKSVAELNLSNEKLASAQQSLRQSEKLASMGQLSAGIAHELNNPLGIITMYSNILLEELEEGDARHADLELIVEQAERCRKIVGGLLNFARKNQVRHQETDIEAFVQRSIESVIIPDPIRVDIQSNLMDKLVEVDMDQFMQVLTNIEKNAIEAMPETGGTLSIILNGDDKEVEFLIKDTGTGISEKNMDKIFTPFFTTKPVGKGTGLGLPLLYGIVKMHKGQIQVESNNNPEKGPTGTTFKVKIPRRK